MADVTNLSKFLGDVADAIRTKRETSDLIAASDFDAEILKIETGTDVSDADATANDILAPKVAYTQHGRVVGAIENEKEPSSDVVATTLVSNAGYYIFDYLPKYNLGLIATSTTATEVLVAKYDSSTNTWDTANAIHISKVVSGTESSDGLSYLVSCKFAGKPVSDKEYYILCSGRNNGNYRYKYFAIYRINVETLEIISKANATYDHDWYTYGNPTYNVMANPNSTNTFFMMIVDSLRQNNHGSIKVTVSNTGASFAEQNTGGMTSNNTNAWCQFSEDGVYMSWYYSGSTLGRVIRTSDNTVAASGWGMNAIYNDDGTYYVFHDYNIYNWSGTKLTNYSSSDFGMTYTCCYWLGRILFLFGSTGTKAFMFNSEWVVTEIMNNSTAFTPTAYTWKQCKLGYPQYRDNTLIFESARGTVVSFSLKESDIIKRFTIGGTIYDAGLDATITAAEMLKGKTAYARGAKLTGTMPNNGALSYTPSEDAKSIPLGYTSGGTVKAVDITSLIEYQKCLDISNDILGNEV